MLLLESGVEISLAFGKFFPLIVVVVLINCLSRHFSFTGSSISIGRQQGSQKVIISF